MERVRVSHPGGPLKGRIHVSGSKSISNRVLILNALAESGNPQGSAYNISNLSTSDDTQTLVRLLAATESNVELLDAHHAGTTFRFMTAYLSLQTGAQTLTGSSRMQERPIGPLVSALRDLGADIEYVHKEGYPPLRIKAFKTQKSQKISIRSDVSSQFISALCMIGPVLKKGIELQLEGELVSRPYLEMTLELIRRYGVESTFQENKIIIRPQKYVPRDFKVESDWSSASYFFLLAAIAPESKIELTSYFSDSLQGDKTIMTLAESFGVKSQLQDGVLNISSGKKNNRDLAFDFIKQPDLAQTIAVMAAAQNISFYYKGLRTLHLKETDRVAALAAELGKVGVWLEELQGGFGSWDYKQSGKLKIEAPVFETYQDHRMALSLAPLGYISPVEIKNPKVVEKSFPDYWKDLETLGFRLEW